MKKKSKKLIKVRVDLESDVLLRLCMQAHMRDMTLNQLCNMILREWIKGDGEENKNVTDRNR